MRPPLLLLALVLASAPVLAAEPEPAPFLRLQLDAAPFRGADPAATRAKAEVFLAGLGRPLTMYQDYDALLAVNVKAKFDAGEGAFAAIERSLRRLRFARGLRALGLGDVREDGDGWEISLRPYLYEGNVRTRLATLGEETEIGTYENKRMKGSIWVNLSIDGLSDSDATAFARRLADAHPREIRKALVLITIPVLRVTTGSK